MDVLFFFKKRTRFIRYFYETAELPFRETIRKIEGEEPPFDNPPYYEDVEPPYMVEWSEANEALEVLGRTCLTILSASLQLYFKTWESKLGICWEKGERKSAFKRGFLQGYRTCYEEVLEVSWTHCPADLELIEQIILARNRDQHPEKITSMKVSHVEKDLEKYPHPFFMSETDQKIYDIYPEMRNLSWMSPAVHVSRETFYQAIDETEKLTGWLEEHMLAVLYRR